MTIFVGPETLIGQALIFLQKKGYPRSGIVGYL